jgi:hypothetical protein
MVSVTAIIRSGYYVLRMLPSLLWLPISIRKSIHHMTDVFEAQLIQSGLDQDVSRQLAKAYHEAHKELVGHMTSLRSWIR